jgi:carbonic anhydrase/acetyltransferase-like protein (isoleucine patch superfamily)
MGMPLIVPFGNSAPKVDRTAWAAPNATLIGAVTMEAHSSVFYGAVLRADVDAIRIGAGSNIQDNVTMHTDAGLALTVGSRVSIGHGAVIHGCTIEDDCLIGMNSTILNGAVIGAGSLIAAGTVVLENTIVPRGSLVAGVPGKAVRSLTADEQASLIENARHYAELSQAHEKAAG